MVRSVPNRVLEAIEKVYSEKMERLVKNSVSDVMTLSLVVFPTFGYDMNLDESCR